jgi:choline dehydrogenase-like flavoprotein
MSTHYDYIIVGSGAGGGTMAYCLAQAGKHVLLIERGGFLPREKENWDPHSVFVANRYTTTEMWKDREGNEFRPGTHYYVGGNTKFYGAALLRLREQDFDEVIHAGGKSPAWPIKYPDMQPYYLLAETLYSVHGLRGADPTEPPEENPYPCPPVSQEPLMAEFFAKLKEMGLHPFPLPEGIRLNEEHPEKSECIRCDTCDGYPCLVNAKANAHTTCVMPALERYPNLELKTECKVERLVQEGSRIVAVEADGERFTADNFIVSCGAINSAALLLRSGVANSSDMVGRHYMCHNNSAIVAITTKKNNVHFQKTIGINDFYHASDEWEYPMGHIQLLGKVKRAMLEGDAPMLTPGLALDYMADHAVGWWITTEDLPDPNNRVQVDKTGQIQLEYNATNAEAHERLLEQLKKILKVLDCDVHIFPNSVYLAKKVPLAGVAHQVGTCRMGTDPKESVVDTNCKAHDLDNLYIVDGSFFPSSSSVNPGLTIMANALRVAHHLTGEMPRVPENEEGVPKRKVAAI